MPEIVHSSKGDKLGKGGKLAGVAKSVVATWSGRLLVVVKAPTALNLSWRRPTLPRDVCIAKGVLSSLGKGNVP